MNADWRIYAHGLREDAVLVSEGRSKCVDSRYVCRDCGKRMRHPGEDYRCESCNREPEGE